MTDVLGMTTSIYDDADRLKDYTNALGFTVSYEYDAAGNVTKLTYPGGKTVTYTYDELNRVKTVGNWLGQSATYTYDDAGRMTKLVNFNGTVTDFGYDNADRLTSLTNKKTDASLISSYSLTLDENGNRRQIVQDEPLAPVMNPASTTYKYNTTKNRLTTVGSTAFTFDTEGQLSKKGSTVYAFDFEHRLATIGTGTSAVQFKYDGAGNRLKAIRGSTETRYIYDASGNLLAEANSANVITKYYIYGGGLLAMVNASDSKTYCYHFNALGSTIAITDSTQAVVNKYAYTPFGVVTQTEAVIQPFKYVGEYGVMTEPNGHYYMRARYYDPAVGRFISEDPIGFAGGDVNLYGYAENNPITFIDPWGLTKGGKQNIKGDDPAMKDANEIKKLLKDPTVSKERKIALRAALKTGIRNAGGKILRGSLGALGPVLLLADIVDASEGNAGEDELIKEYEAKSAKPQPAPSQQISNTREKRARKSYK